MQGLGQLGKGSTILVNRLAKPSSPVGKTHASFQVFSPVHCFMSSESVVLVAPSPGHQLAREFATCSKADFSKPNCCFPQKKTHIISGPALFLFRRKHPTPPSPRLHQTSEHWGQPAADAPQGRPRNQLSTTGEPGCQLISDGS